MYMFSKPKTRMLILVASVLVVGVLVVSCAGAEGPAGPAGPAGDEGPAGPAGEAGGGGGAMAEPEYVGSEACGQCHEETYATFMQTGHPYKLNAVVDGQPPEYPFTEVTDTPEGVEWSDVTYVIGGYGWKARFVGSDGYIITGEEGDTEYLNQYNFYSEELDLGDSWSGYHPGEANKPYNCGPCHTTGYSNYPEGTHQDDLEGIVGTWAQPGVHCEECHGPASLHVENPGNELLRPEVTRSSELCGECHIRGDVEQIDFKGGFIRHHEQYEERFQSKHRSLECVDCHDPHATTVYRDDPDALASGIRIECENCHWQQEQFQSTHPAAASCIDCHMANLVKSALGDPDRLMGDVSSHLFAINPYAVTAEEQFYTTDDDKTFSEGYITLAYACTQCHSEGGMATPKTDDQLQDMAIDFHARQ
jgi:hypothetical protein